MAITAKIPNLLKIANATQAYRAHNYVLLDVFKGRLLPYIEESLRAQLNGNALKQAMNRVSPINVMGQIVRKQAKIYSQGVSRSVEGGDEGARLVGAGRRLAGAEHGAVGGGVLVGADGEAEQVDELIARDAQGLGRLCEAHEGGAAGGVGVARRIFGAGAVQPQPVEGALHEVDRGRRRRLQLGG